ncbi:hypothetical protein E2I00_011791 [Balaenoptera physalus]|uniref:Testis-expressed protein 13 A-D N-terminal domain-containing protein n=1 Tax=Balaenoptera physalus TaxID=9770 RepID=A0A643BY18_BALPH|nr:hypothetical protein E2I00_011791 [Balaenoptera physalus]
MAVDFRDPSSGFRHNEVVTFINEEVLSNGCGPNFCLTFRSRPWNEIEDELQSILANPQVPHAIKKACAWSALALSVRVATRHQEQQGHQVQRLQEQEQQGHQVQRLQEQVGQRETATWALTSHLQRLREEREETVRQLRCTRSYLQQVLKEHEALRKQLLQAEMQSQEFVSRSQAQQLRADVWPLTPEERNTLLVTTSQRRQMEEAQNASAGGVLYVPLPPSSWPQVVQPPPPMPFHMPFPYPPPPAPRVVSEAEAAAAAAAFPPQMPAGGIYQPGMQPAVVSQEEVALQWDPRIQGQEEGPVRLPLRKSLGAQLEPRRPNEATTSGTDAQATRGFFSVMMG